MTRTGRGLPARHKDRLCREDRKLICYLGPIEETNRESVQDFPMGGWDRSRDQMCSWNDVPGW